VSSEERMKEIAFENLTKKTIRELIEKARAENVNPKLTWGLMAMEVMKLDEAFAVASQNVVKLEEANPAEIIKDLMSNGCKLAFALLETQDMSTPEVRQAYLDFKTTNIDKEITEAREEKRHKHQGTDGRW